MGYRREYQVEARGEVAVRGSIVDVYPVTDDHPARIDLWGDEVDRLTAFAVADQRSTHDVPEVAVFPAREVLPGPEVRERAAELVRAEPWGAETFERLAEGQTFDGMESWLPWLTADERLLPDLLPDDALVLACEPRRMRDRAQELLDEEAALATTLAVTWGATDRGSGEEWPRLSLPFDRLLAHTSAGTTNVLATPEGPDTPHLPATAFDPIVGDTTGLADRLRRLAGDGVRVVLAADGTGSADRLAHVLDDEGVDTTIGAIAPGTIGIVVAPVDRGVVVPSAGLAIVGEADLTGRRRVHRRPRGARRGTDVYDALTAGDYVVHYVHGVARYEGMVQRAIGGVARDYLLLEYKGARQAVRAHRSGAQRPALHGWRDADAASDGWRRLREVEVARPRRGARDRAGARGALPPAPRQPRPPVRARHTVAARDRGGLPVRGDARPGEGDHRGQGRHGAAPPHGPARVRRRRLRQDGGRAARRIQGGPGRHAGCRARAYDAAREPARADVP